MSLFFLEENGKLGTFGLYLSTWKSFDEFGLSLTYGLGCCFRKSKVGLWIRSSMVAWLKATSVTCYHFDVTSDMSFPTSN